jgi:hypothetical protein
VIVVDDYRTLPHALGVAAATWEAVAEGRLIPVIASEQKLYACVAGKEGGIPAQLQRCASEVFDGAGVIQDMAGATALVFTDSQLTSGLGDAEPQPVPVVEPTDADEIRQRLALIEGSRTWRIRSKLARLLPTRR